MSKAVSPARKILKVLRSRNLYSFYILFALFGFCTLFYYLGELLNVFWWQTLHWDFFYSVHDIHRLLFLAPIIYAGYVFGVRATIIVTIIALMVFIPRALFVSPFPDATLRMIVFGIIEGTMGYLTARVCSETKRRLRLEALGGKQRDIILGMLDRMDAGVFIIGPDYRVRFLNAAMIRDFGEGKGAYCYQYLRKLDQPCQDVCKLECVRAGAVEEWDCDFPDGRTFRMLSSPYVDYDGTVCQLAIFRKGRSSGEIKQQ